MATKQIHQLGEATALLDAELLHVEVTGDLDKKITKLNLLKELQAEVDLNTTASATGVTDIANLQGLNANNQVGVAYEIALSDADAGEIWMNNAAANVFTIPLHATTAMPERTYLVMMEGVGVTTITAVAGVTLNGIDGGSVAISAQYTGASITKRADNTWVITGNIGTVA